MAAPAESETPARSNSDDPVAEAILALLAKCGAGKSISPEDAARAFAAGRVGPPELWRRYLPAVRQQALSLARRGRIRILRKGKAVDPHAPVKGVIRLARVSEADADIG
jgi:hypothetical protein